MTNPAIASFLLSSVLIPATPLTIESIPKMTPKIGMNPAIPKPNAYAPFLFSESITFNLNFKYDK